MYKKSSIYLASLGKMQLKLIILTIKMFSIQIKKREIRIKWKNIVFFVKTKFLKILNSATWRLLTSISMSTQGFVIHRAFSVMASFVLYLLLRGSWVFVAYCTDLLSANQTRVLRHQIRWHADLPVSPFIDAMSSAWSYVCKIVRHRRNGNH